MENYRTEKAKIDSVLHIRTSKHQNQILFHLVSTTTDTYYELTESYQEQRLKYKNKILYITYYFKKDEYKRKKAVTIHTQEEFLIYINNIMAVFLKEYKSNILNEDFEYEDNIELFLRKYARYKNLKIDTEKAVSMLMNKFPDYERLKMYYKMKEF